MGFNSRISIREATNIRDLYNGLGVYGVIGVDRKQERTKFYALKWPDGIGELTPQSILLLESLQRFLHITASPLAAAFEKYEALKQKLGSFLVESQIFQGRRIEAGRWLGDPDETLERASYQTYGNMLSLQAMLNTALHCTTALEKRVVLYAGLGANTSNNCRFNLVHPLLLTNFDELIGTEYSPMAFNDFQQAAARELKSIRDPASGNYLHESLIFRLLSDNVYEASFNYLVGRRTIRAYFGTDINSNSFPASGINIVYDDSHAMSRETFYRLMASLPPHGILIGAGTGHYCLPGRDYIPFEFFLEHFKEICSQEFFELTVASYCLVNQTQLGDADPLRLIIYQKQA